MVQLKRFHVVLVAPKIPENIGSVARLLENYNVGKGSLVSPQCEWKSGVAQWMATGPSIKRLNSLPVHDSLAKAVKDANFVVGFTARSGKNRKTSIKLEDLGKTLQGKVALVFGREDFCLLKEEIEVCTHLCALDTNPKFPALNLSHSVAVALSQIALQENDSRRGHHGLATTEAQEPMFEHLKEMLVSVGMTKAGNPELMLTKLRKVLQRSQLTKADIGVVRGLCSRIISEVKSLRKN